ncbi:hypothetical protein Tco_0313001 [Tanacetum coccineum]
MPEARVRGAAVNLLRSQKCHMGSHSNMGLLRLSYLEGGIAISFSKTMCHLMDSGLLKNDVFQVRPPVSLPYNCYVLATSVHQSIDHPCSASQSACSALQSGTLVQLVCTSFNLFLEIRVVIFSHLVPGDLKKFEGCWLIGLLELLEILCKECKFFCIFLYPSELVKDPVFFRY